MSHFDRRFGLVAVLVLTQAGLACSDDPPDPTGDMERPSGLAVITRSGDGIPREDLLIADPEAQGVRLLQYAVDANDIVRGAFFPAPLVFFPLVIPAPGFPSELSASGHGERVYALSAGYSADGVTVVGALHVLAVQSELDYRHPVYQALGQAPAPNSVPNVLLYSIPLDGYAGGGLPVDLEVISSAASPDSGPDRVAILFDRFDGPGEVVVIDVPADPVDAPPPVVASVGVGLAPRQMARGTEISADPTTLLIAQSGSSTTANYVSVVEVSGDIATARPVPGIGGPVSRVVPLTGLGALALRVDRAAVVVLEESAGTYAVSTRDFGSPHTPEDERGTVAARGRIDLPRTAVSAAEAMVEAFPGEILDEGETLRAVMLTLLDGSATFLVGETLALQIADDARLIGSDLLGGALDQTFIRQCDPALTNWCTQLDSDAVIDCPGLVQVDQPVGQTYRAVFRGPLVQSRVATMELLMDTSTTSVRAVIAEPGIDDYSRRHVRVSDRVLVQAVLPPCAGATEEVPVYLVAEGEVLAVDVALEVQLTEFRAGSVTAPELAGCIDDPDIPILGLSALEVFPRDREVVVQITDGSENILEIHARAPVASSPAEGEVAWIHEQPDGRLSWIDLTVAHPGTFSCVESSPAERRCIFNTDCGDGRDCASPPESATEICPRQCEATCAQGASRCVPIEVARICPGVELRISPTVISRVNLGDLGLASEGSTGEIVNAAPYDTAWLPLRKAWVTSFPGSRTLVQVRPTELGFTTAITR